MNSRPGSPFIEAWLVASAFLLSVLLSACPKSNRVLLLTVYAFAWFALSGLVGIYGVITWWNYLDIGYILCGWLAGYAAVRAWTSMARRRQLHAQ